MSPAALKREAKQDMEDAYNVGDKWSFTWQQLAFIAMRRWTLAEIHEALGADASRVLPPMLTLRRVTVRLPEFIVRALEMVADDEGVTLDAALHGEMIDFAGTMAARIEKKVPGFRRAYFYPGPA